MEDLEEFVKKVQTRTRISFVQHNAAMIALVVVFLAVMCFCTATFVMFYFVFPAKTPETGTVLFSYLSCGNNTESVDCTEKNAFKVYVGEADKGALEDRKFKFQTPRGELSVLYNSTSLSQIGFRGRWRLKRESPLPDENVLSYVTLKDKYEYYFKNESIAECFAYCGYYLK